MSKGTKYLLVSLPTSISPTNEHDEALTTLRSTISNEHGSVFPFLIPEFKIGSLDTLVQQADDLSKLHSSYEGVVGKAEDCLKTILNGDQQKIDQQKTINDKPADAYLKSFRWNKVKYRAERSIAELMDVLQKELASIDNDLKTKVNQYNQVRTSLATIEKKQTGNLSTKSLISIVDPSLLIRESEYLETHLLAVPKQLAKEFIKTYETLSPMVVPRSAKLIDSDDEFSLYSVTTFKKYSTEFLQRCRERKWIPREFNFQEDGRKKEREELEKTRVEERRVWGEALRLGRTAWSEAVMGWVHVLTLQVFVESVLRYGLPLSFVCGLISTTPKLIKKAKSSLDVTYAYLGGNAFGRDKKGRIAKDDSSTSADMQAAGQTGDAEYTAYVCYEFEIS